MKFPPSLTLALGALLALPTGCNDAVQPELPVVEPPVALVTVTIPPNAPALVVGGSQQLTYITRDQAGNILYGRPVAWATNNPTVATVSATGLVRGEGAGSATITATSQEGKIGSVAVSVVAPPAPPLSGPEHIYLARADGSGITRLTRGDWPAWSPDGSKIAFHRDGTVYVINADGSNEILLGAGRFPAWLPDGTRIVLTTGEGISVMNVDGSGSVRTLIRHNFRDDTYAEGDMGVGKPAWSPDGKRITFEHLGDGDMMPAQVFVMNADGSDPRLLTASPDRRRYAESDPSWSPDGSSIVLWSYGYGIATVDANGGVPNSMYKSFPAVAYGAKPTWAPDGSIIAFNTFKGSSGESAIWIVPAKGGGAKLLIPDAYYAAWSPDGARLAFVSRRAE